MYNSPWEPGQVHARDIAYIGLAAYPVAGLISLAYVTQERPRLRWLGSGMLSAVIVTGYVAMQVLEHGNL